jgi:DNA primase
MRSAKERDIPQGLLEQAGLVTAQNQDKFVDRLVFPITDVTGRVIGFGGRTLSETGAKYINSPTTVLFDKSNSLYGLEQARHQIVSTSVAVVVEGYTDTIMAHQLGCTNVVATLGTSLTEGHGRMLRRYAKKVVLIFDSDTAGAEAANRALQVCLSQRIDIKLASVPEGKDPCEFLISAGRDRFEQLVDEAVDVFEFKWDRLLESFGSDDTLAGRRLAVDEYLQTVAVGLWAGNMPAVDRGLVVNRLSKIIAVDSKQINAELTRKIKTVARTASRDSGAEKVCNVDWGRGLSAAAQREILEVLLCQPELFETAGQEIAAELFDVPILRQIAAVLFETLRSQSHATLQTVLAKAESVETGRCLVALAEAGEQKGNFESRLAGALEVLQRCQGLKSEAEVSRGEDRPPSLQRVSEDVGKGNRHSLGMV